MLLKKIRSQKGFTLLELLVVIAVIGVLASLAVPRMENQLNKAKFVDVVNSASPFKAAVEMCYLKTNALTACESGGANGYVPVALGASSSGIVNSVSVASNGTITATGGDIFGTIASSNVTYILTPVAKEGGLIWTIGGTCLVHNLCN